MAATTSTSPKFEIVRDPDFLVEEENVRGYKAEHYYPVRIVSTQILGVLLRGNTDSEILTSGPNIQRLLQNDRETWIWLCIYCLALSRPPQGTRVRGIESLY